VLLHGDVVWNGVDERNPGHIFLRVCVVLEAQYSGLTSLSSVICRASGMSRELSVGISQKWRVVSLESLYESLTLDREVEVGDLCSDPD
jgi:hypothetical protein